MGPRRRATVAAASAVTLLAQILAGTTAGAQFPGTNGRIAYDRGVSGQFSIVSVRADGSDLRLLATNAFEPRYDANGDRIAFVATSAGIRVMKSDGSGKHTVTSRANDVTPTWAPGGGRIAFMRGNKLMSIRPDGTGIRTVRSFSTGTYDPSWAPGGGRIAVTHFDAGDNKFHVFTVKPDGTGLKRVPNTGGCSHPDWSPDGARFTFTCQTAASVSDIYIAHTDGTSKKRVTNTPNVREFAPTWSPNHARLLYWIIENAALYTIRPDGTGRTKVRAVTAQSVHSSWQPR